MLDNTTKKNIDDCRDVLVGKLPDPKSQIEQITIALIYKFMDDMDKDVMELGGKTKFFTGNFKKYSWDALFDAKVSSAEMLKLYSAAIESMEKNPNIPQLFRDIFKNAYLPYRDPETLKLFLKSIGEFEYTHSEKLGDAFEYLLSIMSSQGDAGQFRTPRHIIDFLVEAVDPGKTDTILDPACGTAGFLISAFKYIQAPTSLRHSSTTLRVTKESRQAERSRSLTPDERKKLIKNFVGYDISPDMVRLSLVNLYLHGFSDPHIFEYDTLTSENRWDEYYDVILANPPFMSPKGGIRPHKRFTVTSNRSEVLFVDYIAEHLNPNGKAGIIVPEGVIFQSGKAYKELRKMLVENYLWAVVSMPAGVFNPYSGVKTSILLMDKTISKKSGKILFVKIENDGFNLGAQRTEIKGSQLPQALEILKQYKETGTLSASTERSRSEQSRSEAEMAHAVEKSKIAENGEFNLSGGRYVNNAVLQSHFDIVPLGNIFNKVKESVIPSDLDETIINYIGLENISQGTGKLIGNYKKDPNTIKSTKTVFKSEDILYGKLRPNLNKVSFSEIEGICSTDIFVLRASTKILSKFYSFYFRTERFNQEVLKGIKGAQLPRVGYEYFSKIKIPLPPLSIQKEIVAEIEGYQKIIDGAKMVVENYKPKIDTEQDWEMSSLGDTCNIKTGKLNANAAVENGKYPFFTCSKNIFYIDNYAFDCEALMLSGNNATANYDVKYYNGKFNAYQRTYVITIKSDFKNKLLYPLIQNMIEQQLIDLKNKSIGGLTKYLTLPVVKDIKIPLPEINAQRQIVAQIEKEQEMVNSNKQLIEIFEQKIKDKINEVWGANKEDEEELPLNIAAEPGVEYLKK